MKKRESYTTPEMMESIIGCKWSLHVLNEIQQGNRRPGKLEKSAKNLSRKVLTERLKKLVAFGILEKKSFPVIPPKVEYFLTPFGRKFSHLIRAIYKLENQGRN
ncbi:MAG: winged helix-turn-helix transcriptional regulator [Elusimicrobiota bacterium]